MPPQTMQAAVLVKPGEFQIRSVPVPEIGPNDVLIRVARVGVCGTDVHILRGHYAADWLPLIPGHEFSGTVAAIGSATTRFREGDRVIGDCNIGCGQCFFCRKNEIMSCTEVKQLGIHIDGAFAEYVRVPERLVIAIPDEMSFEVAALVEPLACTVRAAKKSAIRFGESVLVLGVGPIGNFHVQLARAIGAAPVIAADLNPARLEMARACGADIVVSDMDDLDRQVHAVTDGRGADVVIESVGLPALYEKAFDLVRSGGRIAAFGLASEEAVARFAPQKVVLKELGMRGSVAAMGDDMHDALTLLRFGRIDTRPFLKESRGLAQTQEAIETFAADPGILKMQIII